MIENTKEKLKQVDWLPDATSYSKNKVLVRSVARALAFVDICLPQTKKLEHHHSERTEGELIGGFNFSDDMESVQIGRPIMKASLLT